MKQVGNSADFFAHFLDQRFAVCEGCGRLAKPVDIGACSGERICVLYGMPRTQVASGSYTNSAICPQ